MYYAFDSAMESTVYDIGGAYRHGRTRGSAWKPVYTSGYSGRALYLNASTTEFDMHQGLYVDAYSSSSSSKFEGRIMLGKTCTSIRFGDVDPACMEYTQSYCAAYSESDAGCSNFTGRVQRTMEVGSGGGVLSTDTPELLRGRKVVVTIPANAVSTTTSLTIRELRADEVAAASQHLVTSRWYRAVLSDYISLVPHGSTFAVPITVDIPYFDNASSVVVVRTDNTTSTTWTELESVTYSTLYYSPPPPSPPSAMLGNDYLHLTVDFYFNLEALAYPDGEALLNFATINSTGLDRDGLSVWLDSSSALWLRRSDDFGVESGDDLLLSASVSYGSWHHIVISTTAPCADAGTAMEVWLDGQQRVTTVLTEAARVYWSLALAKGNYGTVDVGAAALDALFTASTSGIVKRLCSSCAASHREIYYKRLPNRATISLHGYLASNWSSTENVLNVDFELYSSHADALAGTNRWTYCNYYTAPGVGFPGECGATGAVAGQWNTWAPATGGGTGQVDVAFYAQIDCPCV
eukprot:gene9357-11090_t